MKLALASLSLLTSTLLACGGKSTPAVGNAGGNGGTTATAAIPLGIHGCHFVIGTDEFATHRCDVVEGDPLILEKVSGMETFSATIETTNDGVRLQGAMGCGPMVDKCNQTFSADLRKQGSAWVGEIVPQGHDGPWWLAGATFHIDDAAGYGGATYGDAWPQPEE